MTMPARYDGPAFMAELEASGGDFTRALRHGGGTRRRAAAAAALLADLRSPVLHDWQPPGGGERAHCPLRHPRARHRRGRAAGPARARGLHPRCSASWRPRADAEPVRRRSERRAAAGRTTSSGPWVRAPLVSGPAQALALRGLRPPAAGGPTGRRGGAPLQPVLNVWTSWRRRCRVCRAAAGRGSAVGATTPCREAGSRPAIGARPGSPLPGRRPGRTPAVGSESAARLEAYPSEHTTTTGWS